MKTTFRCDGRHRLAGKMKCEEVAKINWAAHRACSVHRPPSSYTAQVIATARHSVALHSSCSVSVKTRGLPLHYSFHSPRSAQAVSSTHRLAPAVRRRTATTTTRLLAYVQRPLFFHASIHPGRHGGTQADRQAGRHAGNQTKHKEWSCVVSE